MSLLPTSKNEVVTGSKSVDIHIIHSWNHIPKKLLQMCLSSILRIAWIMENSLITSLLALGFAKLDRHSSRHCRSNDKTGVIPEPPANALALRWEVYVECRLDTPLWWFGICFQGKFFCWNHSTFSWWKHRFWAQWKFWKKPSNTNGRSFDHLPINQKVSIATIDFAAMRSWKPNFFTWNQEDRAPRLGDRWK